MGPGRLAAARLAVLVALLAPALVAGPLDAKTPGETHCYGEICHRVYTLDETAALVGEPTAVVATYYDHPDVDRFNTGKYTSSGEEFDADNPTRASSANLPDGTEVLVWNPSNGRAVHVRINDFGPFHTDRKLDLTRAAAERLDFLAKGVQTPVALISTRTSPVFGPSRRTVSMVRGLAASWATAARTSMTSPPPNVRCCRSCGPGAATIT